jgi:DNA ligase-associated metallophosphoesterase
MEMTSHGHEMLWGGEALTLLPERAIWWARERSMFIADPHFGKASTFRRAGIAVPETSHDDDLIRLEKILHDYRAKKLVVLGDFFHAKTGRSERTLMALREWRGRHEELEIILVLGNHDRHAGCPPDPWKINCVPEFWALDPFQCVHHPPKEIGSGFVLAGHLHPAFCLSERSGVRATSLCFYFSPRVAILPAFGTFTGKHLLKPKRGDRIFLIGDGDIIDATKLIR